MSNIRPYKIGDLLEIEVDYPWNAQLRIHDIVQVHQIDEESDSNYDEYTGEWIIWVYKVTKTFPPITRENRLWTISENHASPYRSDNDARSWLKREQYYG